MAKTMTGFKFKLNKPGVEAFLKSSKVQGDMNDRAQAVVASAGIGFEMRDYVTHEKNGGRAGTLVYAKTPEAYYKNLRENTLLKSLRAAKR